MIRGILSVITGFAVWTLLWLPSNALIRSLRPDDFRTDGSTENTGILAILVLLSFAFSVIAGYVTAAMARHSKPKHVWALGIVQLAVGIFVQAQFWTVLPMWYHLTFLGLLIPGVLLGGRLRTGVPR